MDSSFRVAFWGLIAGLGLTVALAATDPEAMRLALDTPPPPSIDTVGDETLLADDQSGETPAPMPAEEILHSQPLVVAERPIDESDRDDVAPAPQFVPVPDNRLALDPERPLLVPPFESINRPVPSPPAAAEHPIVDIESSDEGVPIEFQREGGQSRIHVVVRPPREREFIELPAPPEVAQVPEPVPTIVHGPRLTPVLPGIPSPQAPLLGQLVGDDAAIDNEAIEPIDEPRDAAQAAAIDELKTMFESEMALLRGKIESYATNSSLDARLAEILEAQQQLDRERVIHEIGLLRTELEQIQAAEAEAAETAAAAPEPPAAVVITPSVLQPGKIDVELNSAPAAEAFARLGREAGHNLLTSDAVQGNVTAKLQGVAAWEAILALAHSRNCQVINDAGYLVVVPTVDTESEAAPEPSLYSQLLFPSHLAAEEVASILQPLLTPGVGRISCTGGEHPQSIARTQAVLIVDRREVIDRARSILEDVDRPPRTLQITAQIMLVRREGAFRDGVVAALGQQGTIPSSHGEPPRMYCDQSGNCDAATVEMPADELCRRLRTLVDAQTVACPSLQVLDRHQAEISITEEDCRRFSILRAAGVRGQEVAGGSSLRVKPSIAGNGMIHLEVSPGGTLEFSTPREQHASSGAISTSVLIPNGGSLVIGEASQNSSQSRPLMGGLLRPLQGLLPRHQAGVDSATELVVIISACVVQ